MSCNKSSTQSTTSPRKACKCNCKGKNTSKTAAEQPVERSIGIRMTMQPRDTNGRGKIFGGKLLELIDLAGAHAAHRVCKNRFIRDMVTRVMNEVEFRQPVEVNDTVTCYTSIVKVGNTSVTVKVEVEADRAGTIIPVLSSTMVFVAVDENNRPTPIGATGCAGESTATTAETPTAPVRTRSRKRSS
jgi:acyl-CoA thioesterase YciA